METRIPCSSSLRSVFSRCRQQDRRHRPFTAGISKGDDVKRRGEAARAGLPFAKGALAAARVRVTGNGGHPAQT